MRTIRIVIFGMIFLLSAHSFYGQNRWSAEFRPGLNFPTEDLGDFDLQIGNGFEVTLAYRFMPHFSGYVGWGWNQFKIEAPLSEQDDTSFEETGYTFGLQFISSIGESSLSYLIRAGVIYSRIEIEDIIEDITSDNNHELGWQIAAGLQIKLDDKWSLKPELRYRSLSKDIKIGANTTDFDLNYVAIGIGISTIF